ncbi:hypothetical protein Pmani_037930 [Petrolisthes manimaculis]|uniref:DM13 domain-containing protein n=1 Tax=Petrolisthes manimaculis TaxID=1843537 RepID=A0AAE1NFU4_9EUCA|nr:hypothetical protein Pmani_037930 [Petrolisthes manimaculis]
MEVLRAYEGEDIELQLPENLTVYDIDYLGVWCVAFKHNFGHVQIPHSDLWVPPALGQTRVKPEDILEAYSGNDRDVYQTDGVELGVELSSSTTTTNDPPRVHHNHQPSSTDCPSSGLAPQLNNGSCPDSQENVDAGASTTFTLPSQHLVLTLPALTLAVFSSSFSSFSFNLLPLSIVAAFAVAATLSLL